MTDRPGNNFDLLRLMASLAVLLSHACAFTGLPEPLARQSRNQTALGGIAVATFFVISGYLITQSYDRGRSPARFLAARALRLLPALAVTLVILALVLGPLLTTHDLHAYFADPRVGRFVWVNLSLTDFVGGLPGVFEHNRFPDLVDGSLWTLRYEAECYAIVLALGLAGLLRRWTAALLCAAALFACFRWVGGVRVQLESYFAAGAFLYLWRVPLDGRAAAACLALTLASLLTHGFRLAMATTGAYVVIYAAMKLRPLHVRLKADLSYGIYVWAFPVQQIVSMDGGAWWVNVAFSTPIVLALAWLSWTLIEAPCLRLKTRGARAAPLGST